MTFFAELENFEHEVSLWEEVHKITDALQSEDSDAESLFLRETFYNLSPEIQHKMLLSTAFNAKDTIEYSQVMLLLLKKFPEVIPNHWGMVSEKLKLAEQTESPNDPVNPYRKILVCSLLPLLLSHHHLGIPLGQLIVFLQSTIQFCFCYLLQKQGKIVHVENPWGLLVSVMEKFGSSRKWSLPTVLSGPSNLESQWHVLAAFCYKELPVEKCSISENVLQLSYCTSILFIRCLLDYADVGYTENKGEDNNRDDLVLVEGFCVPVTPSLLGQSSKRRRSDSGSGCVVTLSSTAPKHSTVLSGFHAGIKCWELLHWSEAVTQEFQQVANLLQLNNWAYFNLFLIDQDIYHSRYDEAIIKIQHTLTSTTLTSQDRVKLHLKLISCYYKLFKYTDILKSILLIFRHLPASVGKKTTLTSSTSKAHHFHLMSLSKTQCMQYCIEILTRCLKEKLLDPKSAPSDQLLGVLLILIQYQWPSDEELFDQILEIIKGRKRFTFNVFLQFIINIDFLEEFMYLSTPQGGNIILDVLPGQVIKQRTISTRGVDKENKEDFRQAMQRQVPRSKESVDSLLLTFFLEKPELLLSVLSE